MDPASVTPIPPPVRTVERLIVSAGSVTEKYPDGRPISYIQVVVADEGEVI